MSDYGVIPYHGDGSQKQRGEEVAWLREQIQARLDAAKAAPGSNWRALTDEDVSGAAVFDEQWLLLEPQSYLGRTERFGNKTSPQYIERARGELCAHIALNDPQDVIARCEGELSTLQRHQERNGACTEDEREWPCGTVRFTASGYRHRPGYAGHWNDGDHH